MLSGQIAIPFASNANRCPYSLIHPNCLAGFPITNAYAGTSLVTTLPEPTIAPGERVIPERITEFCSKIKKEIDQPMFTKIIQLILVAIKCGLSDQVLQVHREELAANVHVSDQFVNSSVVSVAVLNAVCRGSKLIVGVFIPDEVVLLLNIQSMLSIFIVCSRVVTAAHF